MRIWAVRDTVVATGLSVFKLVLQTVAGFLALSLRFLVVESFKLSIVVPPGRRNKNVAKFGGISALGDSIGSSGEAGVPAKPLLGYKITTTPRSRLHETSVAISIACIHSDVYSFVYIYMGSSSDSSTAG
ncbi:hypothetical protein ACU8KH_00368 [Lachancea thermotolerans]